MATKTKKSNSKKSFLAKTGKEVKKIADRPDPKVTLGRAALKGRKK